MTPTNNRYVTENLQKQAAQSTVQIWTSLRKLVSMLQFSLLVIVWSFKHLFIPGGTRNKRPELWYRVMQLCNKSKRKKGMCLMHKHFSVSQRLCSNKLSINSYTSIIMSFIFRCISCNASINVSWYLALFMRETSPIWLPVHHFSA